MKCNHIILNPRFHYYHNSSNVHHLEGECLLCGDIAARIEYGDMGAHEQRLEQWAKAQKTEVK